MRPGSFDREARRRPRSSGTVGHHKYTGDKARDPDYWSGLSPKWALPLRWMTQDLHYYATWVRAGRPRKEVVETFATSVRLGRGWQVVPLNQNLHLMHHLNPAVPSYRYGTLWAEKRESLLERGVLVVNAAPTSPASG